MKKSIATFGGGCFWCIEAVIQRLNGVEQVVSGYAGGHDPKPNYRTVCSGTSGHAEVIQVTFDPSIISYRDLIMVFMTSHNPTTKDRQGADWGSQYRSIILYQNDEQKRMIDEVINEIRSSFPSDIVTEVSPMGQFFVAEPYHQDYYNKHSTAPYCRAVIDPKVAKLRARYADLMKLNLVQG